jgi:glucokinase
VGNSPVVLGFDFGGTKIATAVCDLMGNRLASATVSTGTATVSAHAIFDRGIRAARDLLATAAPGSEPAAVGVATFGIPFEDRVELAPAIDGWESLALGRELRAAFDGAEIRMATDAKAAATAEVRWGSLQGCDPGVYLNLGTGLAAAIVTGGQVVAGGNGAAGEIGYNLRAVSDVGLSLKQRVHLEDMVSGQGLARRASGHRPGGPGHGGPGHGGPGHGGPGTGAGGPGTGAGGPGTGAGNHPAIAMTAADVFEAGPGDPELDELLTSFVTELAFHLVNLTICINPVRIAVGGGMVRSWERIRPQLERALSAGVPYPPELVVARFPYDAPLLGALALAVDAARGRDEETRTQDTRIQDTTTLDTRIQDTRIQDTTTLDTTTQDTMA